jgi:hypothetical protein
MSAGTVGSVDLLWAVLLVVAVLGLAGWGLVSLARGGGQSATTAAAEIDGLFAPARRHTVEYFHAMELKREEVRSADGDEPDQLRDAVRRAIDDREVEGPAVRGLRRTTRSPGR